MNTSSLKRKINTSKQYDKYFKGTCKSTFIGTGDTNLSIETMAKWVEKYNHQTEKFAFQFLKNQNLAELVESIYNFLHDNIQYKIDGLEQKIRSPFCSWNERQTGIDCKSYSVFASCLLTNLGVKHYLRKIKQPSFSPDQYTHVYVVVPVNQKSLKLDKYYIIDATIHKNNEVAFIGKPKDKLMENVGLPHYGLGFSATNNNIISQFQVDKFKELLNKLEQNQKISRNDSVNALKRLSYFNSIGQKPTLEDLLPKLSNYRGLAGILDGIDFANLGDITTFISCKFSSAFGESELRQEIEHLNFFFNTHIKYLNQGIADNDLERVAENYTYMIGMSALLHYSADAKLKSKTWNSCSRTNLEAFRELCRKFRHNVVNTALKSYVEKFFNISKGSKVTYYSDRIEWFWTGYHNPKIFETSHKYTFEIKDTSISIPAFVIDKSTLTIESGQTSSFLNSLSTIIQQGIPNSNNDSTNTGTTNNPPLTQDSDNIQTAGTSNVLKAITVGGILYAGYTYLKSKKSKK